ncbi:9669_t:CDS:2 [Funneliformis geosporum]|uniref:11720_t:CDS:1 n=1 Tax=Funneliformis geosporum TaxID=1117311 RepID=A0A9W4SDG0_9GLOM|nr:11720_t:CDS:2 [Funneliformis geosporum]CAI2168780.1 9669_t:CDS:2 [Funneliformis geosporum]
MPLPIIKFQPHFMRITPERARRWAPSVMAFTGALGIAALLFVEPIPRIRQDILSNVPILGNYWRPKIEK